VPGTLCHTQWDASDMFLAAIAGKSVLLAVRASCIVCSLHTVWHKLIGPQR
jgi:hypothetical protein